MADAPEYYVLLAAFSDADRSILYVYDAQKHLVYQEVLPERAYVLRLRPLPGTKAQAVYVGGEGRVLKYVAGRRDANGTRLAKGSKPTDSTQRRLRTMRSYA